MSSPGSPFSFTYTPPATTAREATRGAAAEAPAFRVRPNTPQGGRQEDIFEPENHLMALGILSGLTIDTADLILDLRAGPSSSDNTRGSGADSITSEKTQHAHVQMKQWEAGASPGKASLGNASLDNDNAFSGHASSDASLDDVGKDQQSSGCARKGHVHGPIPSSPGDAHYDYHVRVATSCQKEDFLGYFFGFVQFSHERPPGYVLTDYQWAFYFICGLADDELREFLLDTRPASLMEVFRHYHRFAIKRDIDRYLTTPREPDRLTAPREPDHLTAPREPDHLTAPREPDHLTAPRESGPEVAAAVGATRSHVRPVHASHRHSSVDVAGHTAASHEEAADYFFIFPNSRCG